MKRIWSLCCLLILPFVHAQEQVQDVFQFPVKLSQNDTLKAISARLRQIQVLRAAFSQTKKIKALRRPLKSSGQFLFATDQGVLWQTQKPFPSTFVITPKGIQQRSEHSEPLTIAVDERPIIGGFTRVFLSLFSGDTSELEDRFKLYVSGDADNWTIGLEPEKKVMSRLISRIVMRGDSHISEIYFFETSGDTTRIAFEAVVTEEPLSEEERQRFAF